MLLLIATSFFIFYKDRVTKEGISNDRRIITDDGGSLKKYNFEANDYILLKDGARLIKISYDDYLKIIAENRCITYDEAKDIDKLKEGLSDGREFSYYKYIKVFGLDGTLECKYQAQLEATIKLYSNNSFTQIENVSSIKTSLVSAPLNCEWVQTSVDCYPGIDSEEYPIEEVLLAGSGYFKIEYKSLLGITPIWTSDNLFMTSNLNTASIEVDS